MSGQPSPAYQPFLPAPALIARVNAALLQWYTSAQRDLPWRRTDDPYAILVAEVMLQQTQVERVIPKYRQFLAAFPTLADLAAAPTAAVIAAWVPLGYNRRAVSLQALARQVMHDYCGRIPSSIDELLTLKGIGRYTAGAIACFAYRRQVATVDTNIRRVLQRVFIGLEQPQDAPNAAHMLALAEKVLPAGEAYNWNQALMDLGATICTSNNPHCVACPLQDSCSAFRAMSQHSLFPSGSVLRQLRRVAEKQSDYRPAQPFTSSNRYFRGRIVACLSALPAGQHLQLTELGSRLKADFAAEDLPWLQKIVAALIRDGLVEHSEDGVKLP